LRLVGQAATGVVRSIGYAMRSQERFAAFMSRSADERARALGDGLTAAVEASGGQPTQARVSEWDEVGSMASLELSGGHGQPVPLLAWLGGKSFPRHLTVAFDPPASVEHDVVPALAGIERFARSIGLSSIQVSLGARAREQTLPGYRNGLGDFFKEL
jgi:hypothetical protein